MKTSFSFPSRSSIFQATLVFALIQSPPVEGAPGGPTLIKNPSFEENYNPAFPGYSTIDQWTALGGGSGVNEAGGPFHDNSTIPDRARIGFYQGTGGILQSVSGLEIGREHWLQFRYNKRQGGLMGLRTRFAGVEIDNIPSIQVAGANAYHFRQIAFTPTVDSGDLEFLTTATGDATALFDGVTIIPRGPGQVVVQNPSFEASGFIPSEVISPAAFSGWAGTGTYGVTRSGTGVADNGVNSDQEGVGYIQGIGSLSQTINNLVIGQEYQIIYSYNVSEASFGGALRVSMGGSVLQEEFNFIAAGVGQPYYSRTNSWVATSASAPLLFESFDDFGSTAILLDDVQIIGLTLPPCQTTVSVERFDLVANQPVGVTMVDVGLPLYLVSTSAVNVVVISMNPNVAIPTGAAVDRITLSFPQGNTTNVSFSITGVGPGITTFLVSNTLDCASTSFTVRNRTSLVLNPSFEDNSQGGVGYGEINDWIGGSGVNTTAQPFADNGGIPDRAQIGFIQGAGNLSQAIGGLTPGESYWLQFGYNARNCCTDAGSTPLDLIVMFGGVEIGAVSNITAGAYQPATIRFTPATASGTLEFITQLPAAGDRTLLLDAVTIVARTSEDAVVLNPSFEASGAVAAPGYVNPESIGGWLGSGGYGVNISGAGPFADNGRNPDQDSVAFIQEQNSLATQLGPLTPGATYQLSYAYNARSGNTPHLLTTVEGVVAHDADVAPVGGLNPYLTYQFEFVATSATPTLTFAQTAAGDQTVLLDNIRVVRLTGGGVRLTILRTDATTVRIAWPVSATGFILQATDDVNAPNPWPEANLPISVEGNENAVYDVIGGAAKFYRLSGQ